MMWNKSSRQIKTLSASLIIILTFMSVVTISIWALFKIWSTQPEPTVYNIEEIQRNNGIIPRCEDPNITVVKDVTTGQIAYKCGELGIISEIISIYD